MSAPNALRQSLRRTCSQRRHASTVPKHSRLPPKTSPLAHSELPPEKMRALVNLYHQCDTFITPENLSDEIDNAFVYAPAERRLNFSREKSHGMLVAERKARQETPEHAQISDMSTPLEVSAWSAVQPKRVMQVQRALYGLDDNDRPGLEYLKDNAKRILEQNKEDLADSQPVSREPQRLASD